MAYRNGADRIVLLGYDLKYPADYDGTRQHIGTGQRHFFGEYPKSMQHWPSAKVVGGVHIELVELYQSIADQGAVEIINATPNSAIDCFERANIDAI